jgi:flagellar export protein FliJ
VRKFHFPLEGVARLRDVALREREVDLAKAQEAMQQAEAARRLREDELTLSLRSAPRGTVVHVRHLLEQDAELRRLRGELRRQEKVLATCTAKVDLGRERLVEARREAEAVEKLRARRYQEFLYEVLREEQKTTDEVAARKMRARQAA